MEFALEHIDYDFIEPYIVLIGAGASVVLYITPYLIMYGCKTLFSIGRG